MAAKRPNFEELAQPDDPLKPTRRTSSAAAPFTTVLQTNDSVLRGKGGIENLKIYRELLRDDQVSATWAQRRLSLTACDTLVEPGADDALSQQAAAELEAELKSLAWDDITEKMLYSAFYGWGVAEVIWRPNGERVSFDRIVVRDRSRFRFDISRNLYLWTIGGGWQQMPDRKFWTISTGADNHDEPYGLGLAHSLYWPVFFKRNDVKFWLMFLEKFGQPTAIAKLPAGQMEDPATVQRAIAMLQQIATDAGVVVPDSVAVELLEATRSGSADYASMHDAMNAAISKIVVGQTMTTDNGGSRAQGEVHERVAQKIVEADSDLLCGSFNDGPVRWWTEFNFPGAVPPRVYRQTEAPENLLERADRDTKISSLGFEPTEEYIQSTYGEGWQRKSDPLAAMAGALQAAGVPGDQAQFAEGENVALAALRAARRLDQQSIFNAASKFGEDYDTIMGKRVRQVVKAAEFAEDPDTFLRRLDEILAESPSKEQERALSRSFFFASLLGALRVNRKQS